MKEKQIAMEDDDELNAYYFMLYLMDQQVQTLAECADVTKSKLLTDLVFTYPQLDSLEHPGGEDD